MDKHPLPTYTDMVDGGAAGVPRTSSLEPARELVLEAVAQAVDWRRQVVVHRELAVRAAHRAFRRAAWP
jgi:hypothetical protein